MRYTLVLLLLLYAAALPAQPLRLQQFVLEDTAGRPFNLDSLSGKAVFIEAWFPACPPCRTVAPFTILLQQRLHSMSADSNIAWVTICFRQSRQDWLQALPHMPKAIHLYAPGSIYEGSLAQSNFPTFRLFNTNGILEQAVLPTPATFQQLDFLLYAAAKGISLTQAQQMLQQQSDVWQTFYRLWQPYHTSFTRAFDQVLQAVTR